MNTLTPFRWLLLGQLLVAGAPQGLAQETYPVPVTTEHHSRLAHLAAAGSALRLNEVAEARRWLDATPGSHDKWEWRMLDGLCDTSDRSLRTDDWTPIRIEYSADGQRVAVAADDGQVWIFAADGLVLARTIAVSEQAVYAARFSPDASRVATCARDGMLALWSVSSGEKIWEQKSGGEGLADIAFHPDGQQIAFSSWYRGTGSVLGLVSLWNAETGERTWQTEFGVKPVVVVRFSPDGARLAAGTWDALVGIWETAAPGEPQQLDFRDIARFSAIDDIGFSPDGERLVAASKNGSPRVWNFGTGAVEQELRGQDNGESCVAFVSDGGQLLTGGSDGVAELWEAESSERLHRFMGHENRITCLAVRPGGKEFITGSADHSLRVWSFSKRRTFEDPDSSRFVYGATVSHDGRLLATSGQSPADITVWDLRTRQPLRKLTGLDGSINYLDFGPGTFVAGGNWAGDVAIWDAEQGTEVRRLEKQDQGGLQQCAYSPDGRWVAASTNRKRVVVWDAMTGKLVHRVELEADAWGIDFSAESGRLAFGTADGVLHVLATGDWTETLELSAGKSQSNSVKFSPDGLRIASGHEDGSLAVCNLVDGAVVWSKNGHSQRIWSIDFHRDGSLLASGGSDQKLRVWDTSTGDAVLTLADFRSDLYNLAFVPGGDGLVVNATRYQMLLEPRPAR